MSEHLLFLQAAGSGFGSAHDLVAAVSEIIRAPHGKLAAADTHHSAMKNGRAPALDCERIAERFASAGCDGQESLLTTLAVLTTIASPSREVDVDWIASAAGRIGDADLLLETAGVVFAFNTINRIADARRVPLEYRFLRQLKPFQGLVERGLASLARLAYDLSIKHQPSYTVAELQDRLGVVLERLGVATMPDVFQWLSRSPVVLEGILEMLESNIMHAKVRPDLLKEAVAIGAASRAMPGSGLKKAFSQWLPGESLPDSKTLHVWAASSEVAPDSDLVSACRRYAWRVSNAAYTITDEQIHELSALGLSDAERLDLTLATSVFSALAIIERFGAALTPASIAAGQTPTSTKVNQVQVQSI